LDPSVDYLLATGFGTVRLLVLLGTGVAYQGGPSRSRTASPPRPRSKRPPSRRRAAHQRTLQTAMTANTPALPTSQSVCFPTQATKEQNKTKAPPYLHLAVLNAHAAVCRRTSMADGNGSGLLAFNHVADFQIIVCGDGVSMRWARWMRSRWIRGGCYRMMYVGDVGTPTPPSMNQFYARAHDQGAECGCMAWRVEGWDPCFGILDRAVWRSAELRFCGLGDLLTGRWAIEIGDALSVMLAGWVLDILGSFAKWVVC
jgi:hypothetical protein